MKLADKPCYPCVTRHTDEQGFMVEVVHNGLTFRERLVIALASNPAMFTESPETVAENINYQADTIIAEMEKEK